MVLLKAHLQHLHVNHLLHQVHLMLMLTCNLYSVELHYKVKSIINMEAILQVISLLLLEVSNLKEDHRFKTGQLKRLINSRDQNLFRIWTNYYQVETQQMRIMVSKQLKKRVKKKLVQLMIRGILQKEMIHLGILQQLLMKCRLNLYSKVLIREQSKI